MKRFALLVLALSLAAAAGAPAAATQTFYTISTGKNPGMRTPKPGASPQVYVPYGWSGGRQRRRSSRPGPRPRPRPSVHPRPRPLGSALPPAGR